MRGPAISHLGLASRLAHAFFPGFAMGRSTPSPKDSPARTRDDPDPSAPAPARSPARRARPRPYPTSHDSEASLMAIREQESAIGYTVSDMPPLEG